MVGNSVLFCVFLQSWSARGFHGLPQCGFREQRDNREITAIQLQYNRNITAIFSFESASLAEGELCCCTVQRLDFKRFRDLIRQFCEKIAEILQKVCRKSTRKSQPWRIKNSKLVDLRSVERNWSFPTAPERVKTLPSLSTTWLTVTVLFSLCFYFIIIGIVFAFVYIFRYCTVQLLVTVIILYITVYPLVFLWLYLSFPCLVLVVFYCSIWCIFVPLFWPFLSCFGVFFLVVYGITMVLHTTR